MITKIWYSVQNCGDGSAYPRFMESKELAELDQDYMDEGWGESCTGCISIESDTPITIKNSVLTVEELIKDIEGDYEPNDEYFPKERYEALLKLKEAKNVTKKESN